jgi:hypothetical protein
MSEDKDDEWTPAINAAHPTVTRLRKGQPDTYAIAMRMVGNRHSKRALVELVSWLLQRADLSNEPGIMTCTWKPKRNWGKQQ